jgi:undecaprenyl-diphosphatase
MDLASAALLGLVEGVTEFLPVSSTGHLVLVGALLGHHDATSKTFDVVIQLGAVLAVLLHYRSVFLGLARGLWRREAHALRLATSLAVAFMPLAAAGLVLGKHIKRLLFGPGPVGAALLVGGLVMLAAERPWLRGATARLDKLTDVTPSRAMFIGLGQCFALWPGMSRSMTTIVAGQLTGLSTATAAEFSFLLSVPVLGAATVFDLVREHDRLAEAGAIAPLLVATAVSFGSALVVMRGLLRYLGRRGLAPFAAYRVVLGCLVLWLASREPSPIDPGVRTPPLPTAAPRS